MREVVEVVATLTDASPPVLAMFLGLGAIGLAAFAIFVVYSVHRGDRR